jgi:hypothetical protein
VADDVWDEDIIADHGLADSSGLLLRALNLTVRTTGFNTLNGLLGVPDVAGQTVTGYVWEELLASHNTASTFGAAINALTAITLPAIADVVWDEDIVAAHGTGDTAGLLLRALGAVISQRSNNPTLNALLGVPDSAGVNQVDAIWDENIVAAHGTASSAGLLLKALGADISTRSNNPTLNALLGVADTATATIAWTVLDEVVDGANHTTANSVGQRLTAIDDLTQAGGAGDLAAIKTSADKIDSAALSATPTVDSVAHKLDSIITTLATVDKQLIISINIEGTTLRIEIAVEQYGVIQTAPWTRCQAQIFDEAGGIILGGNISIGDFGAIGARGYFTVDINPHGVVAGKTYQIKATVDDAGANTITTTKPFATITG